ncbi:hypothetical protein O181_091478 [Austropuccinia psidii MF-1]|uniref:Uncharacterized protein n=1 Tax=Austropuccinia psidii MF-1 TaxID=1389203 RepID=A0A9Q3P7J8_9BASI|nr:hypothetical protein [Austropuccinia psidii MF-1]
MEYHSIHILIQNSLCHALYALSGVSPAFAPQQQPMLVMLSHKHTRNARSLFNPLDHAARGYPAQDAIARNPLWLTMMKVFPSENGHRDPKQADGNDSGQLALSLPVSICPPPLSGHHPMVTSLLDRSQVIIRPMKDGNGKRTFELGPIVTMSCHPFDSHDNNKTHQIPRNITHPFHICLTRKPHGTQWSEDLLDGKQPTFPLLILTFASSQLTLPPFVQSSQHNETPIPGLSPSSKPPEEILTSCPATPCSVIIIEDMPVGSAPPRLHHFSLV